MPVATTVRTLELPSGDTIPALGQGTWHLAEGRHPRKVEIEALQVGLDLGMRLIDTAEMYGEGETEFLVGEAIAGRREEVFLVSKVLPFHATRTGTVAACEASLARLGTDYLDLYLLHWRSSTPLDETLAGFRTLREAGLIRHWGVSNFDLFDMQTLVGLPGGRAVQTDQVLYNLARRGIEFDLLPWCARSRIPVMAYAPIEQGRLLRHPALDELAAAHDCTPAQIALAWVLRHHAVAAIPEAGTPEHVRENRAALDIELSRDDLAALDRAFPPPKTAKPLEVL